MLSSNMQGDVVLALPHGSNPAPCLSWGQALSSGFGSKLRELYAVPRQVCSDAAAYALRTQAALIVMPIIERLPGRAVTALAATARMPILVAREHNSRRAIVAATDLQSTAYPVLRLASAFERCLNVPIVTVHNVQPTSIVVGTGVSGPSLILLPPNPARAARLERLTAASARLLEEPHPVLRDEASVVDAILDEARRNDAGLVVVGTRKRSWWERLLSGSIAEQIVDRAERSVLVIPMDDRWS